MPPDNRRATTHWLVSALVALLVAALYAAPVWGPPWARTQGQTVPRTPPATWTPVQPPASATPAPTRPTPLWTVLPTGTPEPGTPTPDTPVADTPVAPSAVPSVARPSATPAAPTPSSPGSETDVVLWVQAEPLVIEPGSVVQLRVDLGNLTGEALHDPRVELPAVVGLRYGQVREALGNATVGAAGVVWRPGDLRPTAGGVLVLLATVEAGLLPDTALVLRARVTWAGQELVSREEVLVAPPALLPAAGDPCSDRAERVPTAR